MKKFKTLLFLLVFLFTMPALSEASPSLQTRIDQAPEGATLVIDEGEYEETIVISKPLTLEGKGEVRLRSCEPSPVVTINGSLVTLKNITIEHCGDEKEDTAMYVTGSQHLLEGLTVITKRIGIQLEQANEVTIRNSEITGRKRGNGIDLWKSNRNQLENLVINSVSDGIYLEQSHENTISQNQIQHSRYGMHVMFSNDNTLRENESRLNSTGAMLMKSNGSSVIDNIFAANKNNVHAQGLLLYITENTKVTGNKIESNRVGIYIEEAENNLIDSNKLINNFMGIQFLKATDNKVVENTFVGNVNDAQAIESSNNEVDGNYWDAASKVDVDGNGASEIKFTADPYFLTLTTDVPEYQLFFQAPGLILLQNLLKSAPEQLLTDSVPLMEVTMPVEKETSSTTGLWALCAIMTVASFSLFIVGRKRN